MGFTPRISGEAKCISTGLEAYWDRRGHVQRDSHLRLEKQVLLLLAITNHSSWILFSLSLIGWRMHTWTVSGMGVELQYAGVD